MFDAAWIVEYNTNKNYVYTKVNLDPQYEYAPATEVGINTQILVDTYYSKLKQPGARL